MTLLWQQKHNKVDTLPFRNFLLFCKKMASIIVPPVLQNSSFITLTSDMKLDFITTPTRLKFNSIVGPSHTVVFLRGPRRCGKSTLCTFLKLFDGVCVVCPEQLKDMAALSASSAAKSAEDRAHKQFNMALRNLRPTIVLDACNFHFSDIEPYFVILRRHSMFVNIPPVRYHIRVVNIDPTPLDLRAGGVSDELIQKITFSSTVCNRNVAKIIGDEQATGELVRMYLYDQMDKTRTVRVDDMALDLLKYKESNLREMFKDSWVKAVLDINELNTKDS